MSGTPCDPNPCPTCLPCGPGQYFYCPPPSPQMMFFQGLAGQPGPLAIFGGAYGATMIYYLSNAVSSVVSYAGNYWRTINPAKNATNTWGTPMNGSADWQDIGTFFSSFYGNSWASGASSAAGNTLVTPTSPNQSCQFTVTGTASLRLLILDITARNAGDRLVVNLVLPSTAGITLQFQNATAAGTQLLPAAKFPGNTLTTDGVTFSACLEFVFNGTAWLYQSSNLPA